jgi:hypothetical protein
MMQNKKRSMNLDSRAVVRGLALGLIVATLALGGGAARAGEGFNGSGENGGGVNGGGVTSGGCASVW